MLDEIREYNLYEGILSDKTDTIIEKRLLENHLSGLARVLEVLARGKIYNGNDVTANKNWQDKIKKYLIKWLEKYILSESLSLTINSSKKKEEILSGLKNCLSFNKAKHILFTLNSSNGDYGNQIRMDTIIADAYEKGPLQRFVLLTSQDFFPDKKSGEKTKVESIRANSDWSKVHTEKGKDFIIKITATYLMNKNTFSQNNIQIKRADLVNWCKIADPKYVLFRFNTDEDSTSYNIYRKICINRKGNDTKYAFDKRWLDQFKLLEVPKEEKNIAEYVRNNHADGYRYYYEDMGKGEQIKLIEIKKEGCHE